eukprot:ANDGO_04599.mRNA.1 hypothetical protein
MLQFRVPPIYNFEGHCTDAGSSADPEYSFIDLPGLNDRETDAQVREWMRSSFMHFNCVVFLTDLFNRNSERLLLEEILQLIRDVEDKYGKHRGGVCLEQVRRRLRGAHGTVCGS